MTIINLKIMDEVLEKYNLKLEYNGPAKLKAMSKTRQSIWDTCKNELILGKADSWEEFYYKIHGAAENLSNNTEYHIKKSFQNHGVKNFNFGIFSVDLSLKEDREDFINKMIDEFVKKIVWEHDPLNYCWKYYINN